MKLSGPDLTELCELATSAAVEAGQMIATERPRDVQHKSGAPSLASELVTEIDRRSEDIIVRTLTPTLERFELGILTEEQDDDSSRLRSDYFWCIDPLDGTLPFVEGVPGYAVSIALVDRKGAPYIGVVYDPVEATSFHAISGAGAFRNGSRWLRDRSLSSDELCVFADRSFQEHHTYENMMATLGQIASDIGLTGTRLELAGGAVMNACGVLASPRACYFKTPRPSGGGSLWDFAATACLFQEFGAVATDMSGAPLDLNRAESTSMNHRGALFATDTELAAKIQTLVPTQP